DLVGVGPALVELGAVGHQLGPVVRPAGAERRDGGEQEGEAGRAGGGAGGDEEVLVVGQGQVLQAGRGRDVVDLEPVVVDVDADAAGVDRREVVGVVPGQVERGDSAGLGGGPVGREHAGL